MSELHTQRLGTGHRHWARALFAVMAEVFEEKSETLSDGYLDSLLRRDDFWVIAAFLRGEVVGGVTAHTLPMTRSESAELFIYDVAVRADQQRKGVGRQLLAALRESAADAGIGCVFVPADNEDLHALDFYRALGGSAAPVTIFTFSAAECESAADA